MTRRQWCRDHIDEVAEKCDLAKSIVSEVKQVREFCIKHPAFANSPTRSIYVLISYRDEDVGDLAISSAENWLNTQTPTGGVINPEMSIKKAKEFLKDADKTLRKIPEEKIETPQTVADVAIVKKKPDLSNVPKKEEFAGEAKATALSELYPSETAVALQRSDRPLCNELSCTIDPSKCPASGEDGVKICPRAPVTTTMETVTDIREDLFIQIHVSLSDVDILDMMIRDGEAETLEEAVQLAFDDGINLYRPIEKAPFVPKDNDTVQEGRHPCQGCKDITEDPMYRGKPACLLNMADRVAKGCEDRDLRSI